MGQLVSDFVLERLRAWGITRVFGYPGDGINSFLGAFDRAESEGGPEFIQARHEEMAAFMACGHAKFTGEIGVCIATSGPGAIHLLNGLYDAKLDHVPVVAIVGQTARSAMGGSYQQEVDLQALFKDVASDYLVEVNVAEQLPNALDRALRTAEARRAPTAVIIPADLQEETYHAPQHEFKQVPSSAPSRPRVTVLPAQDDLRLAAEILNAGTKVAILVGQGARGAAEEVRQLAEATGAGVAKALLGKDVLSDELSYVTGSIGLLGTRASYELMRDCDTLLILDQPSRDGPRVRLDGPLDASTVDYLRADLMRRTRAGTRPLLVDLTGVTLLASAGVATLHQAVALSSGHGSPLTLYAPAGSPTQHVLSLVALPHTTRDPDTTIG